MSASWNARGLIIEHAERDCDVGGSHIRNKQHEWQ